MPSVGNFVRKVGSASLWGLFVACLSVATGARAAETWIGNGEPAQGGLIRNLLLFSTTPVTLYASTFGSGIYRSTDEGLSWNAVNAGLTNKRVNTARRTSTTHSLATLYAATDGAGIFRTSTDTINWTPFNTGLSCLYVRSINIVNSNLLFATTQCGVNSGVYRSSGSNAAWEKLNTGTNGMPASVVVYAVTSNSTGTVLRAATDGFGVYFSNNAGSTWTQINGTGGNVLSGPNGVNVFDVDVVTGAASGDLLALVEGGGVFRSSDNGTNWFPSSTGLPSLVNSGHFSSISPYRYLSVKGIGIYRGTVADGWNWTAVTGADNLALPSARGIIQSTTNDPAYSYTLAGVYKGSSNLTGWTPIKNGLPGGYVATSATHPSDPNLIYAAADTIYKSTDGGATWTRSGNGIASPALTVALDYANPSLLYVGTEDHGVFRSTDAGASWVQSNVGLPNVVGQDARVIIDRNSPSTLFVSLQGGGIYKSVDSGANWTNVSGNLTGKGLDVRRVRVDPANSNTLYAATAEGLYKSVNGGTSWSLMFQQVSPAGISQSVGSIGFDRSNTSTVFIGTNNADALGAPFSFSGVWKSTDGGSSWTQPLVGHLVTNIAIVGGGNEPLVVYAGSANETTGGVLRSIDGCSTWSQVNAGLSSTYVRSFERNSVNSRMLRASTQAGLYTLSQGVDAAVDGVAALLSNFLSIVNTQANNLDYTHLLSAFDSGYFNDGVNATLHAKSIASDIRGVTISGFTINKVNSYDDVNGILNVAGTLTTSRGSEYVDGNSEGIFIFKRQTDGSYKFYGNQRIARASVQVEMRTDYGPSYSNGPRQHVNFDVDAPVGVLSTAANAHSVTASPNDWSGLLPLNLTSGTTRIETIQASPSPAPSETVTRVGFFGGYDPGAILVTDATTFQLTLTKADASQVTYNIPVLGTPLSSTSTAAITGVTVNGTSSTSFASWTVLSPLEIAWTLPTGYAIQQVRLSGYVQNTNNEQCSGSDVNLANTATSGQIALPTSCGSGTIVRGGVNVTVEGLQGGSQRSMFSYSFDITGASPPSTASLRVTCPVAVHEGGSATCTANLLRTDNQVQPVSASWSVSGPAGVSIDSATGALTVDASAVSANSTATVTGSFSDSVLTGGQTVTASFTVVIQEGPDHWTGSGPVGQGGDVRSVLALDEGGGATTLLALLYGRGVYRSTDRGASWLPSSFGMSDRRVRAAVVLPDGTGSKLLVATEDGVFRSATRGVTWTASSSGLFCTSLRTIAAHDASTVYLGSQSCGVFKSTNGGLSWFAVNNGLPSPRPPIINLSVSPSSNFLAIGTAGAGVYKSTDAGANWTAINNGLVSGPNGLNAAIFTHPSFFLARVEGGGVYRSTDSGANWSLVSSIPTGAQYGPITSVGGTLYVGLDGVGTYQSSDNGVSWTLFPVSGVAKRRTFLVGDPNASGTLYFATGAGVYKSIDSGATWAKASGGLPGGYVFNVIGIPGTSTVFATANTIYKSLDGGVTWAISDSGIPGYAAINAGSNTGQASGGSIQSNAAGLFVSTTNYGVYKSTDVGASWFAANNGLPPMVGQGPLVSGDPTNSLGLFAVFNNYANGVYRSFDGGESWQSIAGDLSGNALYVRFVAADPKTGELYITTRAGLYKSANGGVNWTLQNNLTGTCGASAVRVDSGTNPSTVYWTARCTDSLGTPTSAAGLYRSIDGGVTSTQLLSGEIVFNMRFTRIGESVTLWVASWSPISTFASSAGLAGVAGRILKSVDGGASWQELSAGLPLVLPRTFNINSSGSKMLRLTTGGAGVFNFSSSSDVASPSAPSNVVASADSTSQITLSWNASADDTAVAGYNILRDGVLVGGANFPITTFVDTGVSPTSSYNYTISACDAAGNCSVQSSSVSANTAVTGAVTYAPSLELSWNLLGNSLNTTLDVAAIFGNQDSPVGGITEHIISVWKWNAMDARWAFYSPKLTVAGIASHAALRNFDVLTTINPGEGYWVQATNPVTLPAQSGTAFNWIGSEFLHGSNIFQDLPHGFNLIAQARSVTPSQFNNGVSPTPPDQGVVTTNNIISLWAWNATLQNWYFYSPLLESMGTITAVKDYADSKTYLHFQDYNKNLGAGVGFWVNRP